MRNRLRFFGDDAGGDGHKATENGPAEGLCKVLAEDAVLSAADGAVDAIHDQRCRQPANQAQRGADGAVFHRRLDIPVDHGFGDAEADRDKQSAQAEADDVSDQVFPLIGPDDFVEAVALSGPDSTNCPVRLPGRDCCPSR